ncbi:MAG: polysaccharide deacetylase family protein [Gemmatimonadota bacterium]
MRAILTYHSLDRTGSPISVTPEAFRAQIEWLARSEIVVVSVPELLALPVGVNGVAITFDDALESVAMEAAPVLVAHAFPATVFVVTSHVGGDNRWRGDGDRKIPVQRVLEWPELARLQERGFTVGAHTRHHPDLTRCSSAELTDEVAGSADDIAKSLGARPQLFAYPYGAYNPAVASVVAATFDIACTTVFQPLRPDTPRELVPRLDAWYFKGTAHLSRWGTRSLTGWIGFRHALRSLRRIAS